VPHRCKHPQKFGIHKMGNTFEHHDFTSPNQLCLQGLDSGLHKKMQKPI
jgi:hypothetical protein